jgi:inosine-uridine nucleoside N-ribohydrolase
LILRTARESEGLTIIAVGPLTNVAAALVADPALADRLERVMVMGGAFAVPGNVTPTAEFNLFMDPEAAQIVLESGVRPHSCTTRSPWPDCFGPSSSRSNRRSSRSRRRARHPVVRR